MSPFLVSAVVAFGLDTTAAKGINDQRVSQVVTNSAVMSAVQL